MLMKNFFVIFTFLLLALADLGSSAPQKRDPELPTLGLQDVTTGLAAVDPKDPFAGLTKACHDAIDKNVLQTSLMTCLPIDALIKLAENQALIGQVAKDPLKSIPLLKPIFEDACLVTPQCEDAAVQAAATAVFAGCAADIKSKVPIAELIFAGLVIYTPAIDIICFKDHAAEFCLVETDKILLSLPPPQIPIPGLQKLPPLVGSIALATPIYICTPCNKAIINTFFDYYKDPANALFNLVLSQLGYTTDLNKTLNLAVDVKCGITPFNDGKVGNPSQGPDPPAGP